LSDSEKKYVSLFENLVDKMPLWCIILAALIFCNINYAHTQSHTKSEVQAAFLFNFAKFVDWPKSAFSDSSRSFIIGIIGDDPYEEVLDRIVIDQSVKNKKISIQRLNWFDTFKQCHILFISNSEEKRLKWILNRIQGLSVLTVSEMPLFTERGGIIKFILKNNKVRFEINLEAANHANLKISSQLLRLAENLKKEFGWEGN